MRTRPVSLLTILALLVGLASSALAGSPYTPSAGKSAPTVRMEREVLGDDGRMRKTYEYVRPAQDRWGNANGNQHDLAVDGAFEGQTVAVIQLYAIGFDFSLARDALKEKGFSVFRWINQPPSPAVLEESLKKASQLWIIATDQQLLTPEHLRVIKNFFNAGHGVYIWGDNQPYYADANYVAEALFGTSMHGDLRGDQTVTMQKAAGGVGVVPNHLLTTGLEQLYEGITIATIQPSSTLTPLLYGSAGNLVAAYHDQDGRRAILDGGFTRLYNKWDTAGTARYVKNAASWLVNAERFGDEVISKKLATTNVIATTEPPPATVVDAPAPAPATAKPAPSRLASNAIGILLVALMTGFLLLIYIPDLTRRS